MQLRRDVQEINPRTQAFGIDIYDDDSAIFCDKLVANMGIWSHEGIIYHLWVEPLYRGKHIGTELLQKAEAKLDKLGFKTFKIMVSEWNTQAIEFYRRRGYKMTKQIEIGYRVMKRRNRWI
jgi:ribosomal protein S18 acetylase RimI-like enzyme